MTRSYPCKPARFYHLCISFFQFYNRRRERNELSTSLGDVGWDSYFNERCRTDNEDLLRDWVVAEIWSLLYR